MKISLYIDVLDSNNYVYHRGITTDCVETDQKQINPKWVAGPCRTYRVMLDIPDLARVHRIDVKQENIEEVKE